MSRRTFTTKAKKDSLSPLDFTPATVSGTPAEQKKTRVANYVGQLSRYCLLSKKLLQAAVALAKKPGKKEVFMSGQDITLADIVHAHDRTVADLKRLAKGANLVFKSAGSGSATRPSKISAVFLAFVTDILDRWETLDHRIRDRVRALVSDRVLSRAFILAFVAAYNRATKQSCGRVYTPDLGSKFGEPFRTYISPIIEGIPDEMKVELNRSKGNTNNVMRITTPKAFGQQFIMTLFSIMTVKEPVGERITIYSNELLELSRYFKTYERTKVSTTSEEELLKLKFGDEYDQVKFNSITPLEYEDLKNAKSKATDKFKERDGYGSILRHLPLPRTRSPTRRTTKR